ncbi:MAG: hypothetical protein FWD82_06395 [Defluviitaleaceae bacterium]|nr:hypothetical protein [Defluviitaleaceae bacterium]
MSKTYNGEHGIVKMNVQLRDSNHIYQMLETYTTMQRFSNDDELLIKFEIQTTLDNQFEILYLEAIVQANQSKSNVSLKFRNDNNDNRNYLFCGDSYNTLGIATNYLHISSDIYAKIRSKIVEIFNPDYEFITCDIINILRESQNPTIIEWIVEWDKRVDENQDTKQEQSRK